MKQILKYVIYILCFLLGILISFNLKENFSLGNEIYISNRLFLKDICEKPAPAPDPSLKLPDCPDNSNCDITKVNSSSIKEKLVDTNTEDFNIIDLFDDTLNDNSVVFNANMSSEVINNIARQVFFIVGENKHSAEFSDKRVGLFFKPGTYGTEEPIRIKVNYYTGVYGLGKTPEDVVINGTIQVCNVDSYDNLTSSCNWLGPYNALNKEGILDDETYLGAKCPLNPNKPDKLYLDDGNLYDGDNMIGKTPVKNLCHDNYDGALDNFWRGLENLTLIVNNINKHLQFSNASGNYTVSDQSDWPKFSDLNSLSNTKLDYIGNYNPSSYSLSDNSLQSPNLIWNKDYHIDFSKYNSWAASQACAVRRLNCSGVFLLSETQGHSSGGFIADSIFNSNIDVTLQYGTQQQYLTRNCDIQTGNGINGGAWNLVFVGSKINNWFEGWNSSPISTVIDNTEVIAQKPYIYFDNDDNNYRLAVPSEKENCSGVTDYNDLNASYILSGDNVIIIKNDDDFKKINKEFNKKDTKIIIITPNVYNLENSINIEGNFIILGIGMPTIRAPQKEPAIVARKIKGGRLAGILIEASLGVKDCLVNWGDITDNDTNASNSYIHDLYCRVGGNLNASNCCVRVTDSMLKISKSHTIIDNAWLWVADHGNDMPASSKCSSDLTDSDILWETIWYNAYCPTCLHVTNSASKVTAYCLQAEHSTGGNIVNWYGDNGSIYMFQSEFPYHPIDKVLTTIESDDMENYKNNVYYDYNAINVVDKNTDNQGKHLSVYGGGAYSYFVCDKNGSGIIIDNSFNLGDDPGNYNLFSRYLDGSRKSGIKNTINNGIDACKPIIYNDDTHLISSFIEGDPDDYHKNQPFRDLNIDGEDKYYKWCQKGLKRVPLNEKDTHNNGYLIIGNE